jgi:predicted nucleotidyltransferase
MILKPQDILVLLKLVVIQGKPWSYNQLALDLGMSPAEVHAGVKRLLMAQLGANKDGKLTPDIQALSEFLTSRLRYVFVPERGELTRGMPTRYSALPLREMIAAPDEPIPVWPDPEGEARGVSFSPLYKSVPKAARADPALYELLTLVDAIRGGSPPESKLALQLLQDRLGSSPGAKTDTGRPDADLVIGNQLAISRSELETLARQFHIRQLGLFGSAARGELRTDSDIDLLVEFEPGQAPSLWDASRIQESFSRLFGGRPVDIVSPEVLRNPYRRKSIEKDLKVLFNEAA